MSSRSGIGSSTSRGSASGASGLLSAESPERRSQSRPSLSPPTGAAMSRHSAASASLAPRSHLPALAGNTRSSHSPGSARSSLWARAAPASGTGSLATTMTAPQPQQMSGNWARSIASGSHLAALPLGAAGAPPGTMTPQHSQAMPTASVLKPHSVQQLVLAGNINGSTSLGGAEADRRVSELQSRLGGRGIDWHDALDELADLHADGRISENTYLQLCNAAKRQREGKVRPQAGARSPEAGSPWR